MFFSSNLLSTLILLPLVGAFGMLFVPSRYTNVIKTTVLSISLIEFILSLNLWMQFDNSTAKFQFVEVYEWIDNSILFLFRNRWNIFIFCSFNNTIDTYLSISQLRSYKK